MTTTVIWNHRNRVNKSGQGPLEVRIILNRKPYYISTGIKCRPQEWKFGRIINRADQDELNKRLDVIVRNIEAEITRYLDAHTSIDVSAIKRLAWGDNISVSHANFIEWVNEQIPLLDVTSGTRAHYYTMVTRLRACGIFYTWSDVTVENIYKWDAFLHTIRKEQSEAQKLSGAVPVQISGACIYNYHKTLKAILNRAVKVGKLQNNPYSRLRGEFRRCDNPNVDYLTEEEIKAFMSLTPVGSMASLAKDLFIFQMFTGLSYSDMMAFDASSYKMIGGKWRYIGERIKTGVPYVSQLLPPAIEVLEKYKWHIPHLSNQKYNQAIKALAVAAGIRTQIHSHIARHTFATMMLRNGAKIENVSKMLGHTNITQTQRYAKVLAQSVHDDFDLVASKLAL